MQCCKQRACSSRIILYTPSCFFLFLSAALTVLFSDLSTLTALEEYLTETYQGCLLVVSHDNFFVNRVAEHLFVFQGEGVVRDFHGSYTEYLEYRRDQKQHIAK